ncbi:asparaginase [Candidatus Micrarchaeota archaeon]|nr:asparaginase [Candidatus Micrarchaeota archaeon]MBU1166183.1 asparaginase [Candidatus Micrarchaeota archaeon]MBU1886581.1 asparaginase [Candidatus Micrarchaeota archaeon]
MNKTYGSIHFVLTGGTIDSHFNPAKDQVTIGEKTSVEEYIKKLQLYNEYQFEIVVLKDSRDLRYKDRQEILATVKNSPHKMIIITHGTYTMPDTGQYLKDNLHETDKTVVLVGSMIPLKGFDLSDAPFNLGYAIANVQILSPGVYICMNGKSFDPEKVDKNKMEGRFEEILDK